MSGLSDYRFRPEHRLLNKRQYQAVFDAVDGKVSPPLFTLLIRGNAEGSSPRLGLVFARRNIRLAVERNRLKRVIRESFRHHRHELPMVDMVLIARHGMDRASNAEVSQALAKAWRQASRRYRGNQQAVTRHENPAASAGADLPLRS